MASTGSSPTPSRRTPLPDGTIPVAISLVIAGIASYLFLRVGKTALGSDDALQPIASLWFATFALAPGFFLPVEQELARALSHRRALGMGGTPVLSKVLRLCVVIAVAVAIGILAISPKLNSEFFRNEWSMIIALIIAFAAYAPAHVARGIASGNGRFRAYALVMGGDGVVRIVVCLGLAVLGVKSVGPYGLAIALSPLPAVMWVGWRGQLHTDPGPAASWREVTPNLGWLLLGSVFAAGLVNAGPLVASLLSESHEKERVTQFGYGVLLARIPLFLFQAVQASLLPRLSRLAARREFREFRSGLRRLLNVVVVVAVIGTVGAYLLGPFIIEKFYGATLSKKTMLMLAIGSALYMVALALAQAVIALRGHALVALGWGVGMVALVISVLVGPDQLFRRVEIALVVSSIASLAVFMLALRWRLRHDRSPEEADVLAALIDMPFET